MIQLEVKVHLEALLAQEDTDGDRQITICDRGPGRYQAGPLLVEGTYALSNLLQELALAQQAGLEWLELEPERLWEAPTQRISRGIRERCWAGLTRRMDLDSLEKVLLDPKMPSPPRLYLPTGDRRSQEYYANSSIEVCILPTQYTPEFVLSLNDRPGMLGLAIEEEPLPYVVPGGRFNEMYGWDSYFIGLGLLHDGHDELARHLLTHQVYQIQHYGKVLNANRSYYLTRTQPPFLTRFLLAVLEHRSEPLQWIHQVMEAAVQEYSKVWMSAPRLCPNGLSRYHAQGIGLPPETESGHYDAVLAPYAEKAGKSLLEFQQLYLARQINCPELDAYFVHDRSVRESGHDTSYRLEARAARLCTVDLNSLLYRYEMDLALLTQRYGAPPGCPSSEEWQGWAQLRQQRLNQWCWDESAGQYFDCDQETGQKTGFCSATGLWPLWAGMASQEQAERAFQAAPLQAGGLAGSSLDSRGPLGPHRPERQWDYPYGWAPHQIMAWEGLTRYGLPSGDWAFRWIRMITRNAVDFNGVIPEKYNVVSQSHQVFAEYGNVGTDFDYITPEGFGWTNASYQLGLTYLSPEQIKELNSMA